MHISLTLPNPLASLTRILVAVERRREGSDPRLVGPLDTVDRRNNPGEESRADDHHDLESLSLSRCSPAPERRCDDLDFVSLSIVDRPPLGRCDSLADLSLTRRFPPRTGP